MNKQLLIPVFLVLILCLALPVQAHVPVNADGNSDISTALSVENPAKSYIIYGHLHEAGEVAWYKLHVNPGERLVLSLMTSGYDTSIPDMIIMSPGTDGSSEGSSPTINIPHGYTSQIIRGRPSEKAEYEPFSPAAIFEVASYSQEIDTPGLRYLAVVSPTDETRYSIAIGYKEEFTPSEWVLVPVSVISIYLWEGQSILTILAPFLAVVILGFVVISRRQKRNGLYLTPSCWLATSAGLCYLGGAAILLVQMVRALVITGFSSSIALTLVFASAPVVLSVWALRKARSRSIRTILDRGSLLLIGILGFVFWAGVLIGPVLAIGAAVIPEHLPSHRATKN
jgi:hypothetical protein